MTGPSREEMARAALIMLRDARDMLKAAGAVRTVAKLRPVISSAEGAVRASMYRDMREIEGVPSHDEMVGDKP